MPAVEVDQVSKSFSTKAAVQNLSFSVDRGEIFGLIGPNGAGKTTTIRMMMDILKPDSGQINILGQKLNESGKSRLGYLPEDRGLYKKLRVIDSIVYLASLKGMNPGKAATRAGELLAQTGMSQARNKKIEELSKGMGQIIQFIVTIIHEPELLILDEPFTALDPINTELLKNMVQELRTRGKAIILSTHQMNQVEELCDRVLMIDDGRSALYGNVAEIKSRFSSHSIFVDYQGDAGELPGITQKIQHRGYSEYVLDKMTAPQQVLQRLVASGVKVNRFEIATPSLNEIFLEVAAKKHE
jgi:ABC-2 type transport system ATP-binding protein